MRALLDVCSLLALIDANHQFHLKVSAWFALNAPICGWASCPLTQNGATRILGNSGYPNQQLPQTTLLKLAAMFAKPEHDFWPDSVSLTDPAVFNQGIILTSGQLTDVYLLGLAVKNGGRLVTTDSKILTTAVVGFQSGNLIVL